MPAISCHSWPSIDAAHTITAARKIPAPHAWARQPETHPSDSRRGRWANDCDVPGSRPLCPAGGERICCPTDKELSMYRLMMSQKLTLEHQLSGLLSPNLILT